MFYNVIGDNMEKKQRQILHVDVNNAFLSWTAIDRLAQGEKVDIREIEAVIGGDESKRSGIVLAKSMKAKARGVHTAETLYQARLKCPNLQVFKGDYKSYRKHSNDLYQILSQCPKADQLVDTASYGDGDHYVKERIIHAGSDNATAITYKKTFRK